MFQVFDGVKFGTFGTLRGSELEKDWKSPAFPLLSFHHPGVYLQFNVQQYTPHEDPYCNTCYVTLTRHDERLLAITRFMCGFFPSRSPTSLVSTGKCLTHLLGCCFSVSLSIFLRVFCFMEVKGLRSEEKWWHQRGRTNLDYGYANFVTTSIFGEDKSSLEGGHVGLGNALTGFCGGWVWRHAVCV